MHNNSDLRPGVPVILADGQYPENPRVIEFLKNAGTIICCDGAVVKLVENGLVPHYIVGDMDSLPDTYRQRFNAIVSASDDQATNDFTKAVEKALEIGMPEAVVLGATGLREDHTLGNIGLLAEHGHKLKLEIITDFGVFTPAYEPTRFVSFKGQQVSLFSVLQKPGISSFGLKYPLNKMVLENLWNGTLNESLADVFSIDFDAGVVVVFRAF